MKTNPKDALLDTYESQCIENQNKLENFNLSIDGEQDYKLARKTLTNLISNSNDALINLMDLANSSEHPRAYEVLAGLLKTTGDLAKQLISLQKKRYELNDLNNPSPEDKINIDGSTTNTAIFIGSTPELQKLIKGENAKDVTILNNE